MISRIFFQDLCPAHQLQQSTFHLKITDALRADPGDENEIQAGPAFFKLPFMQPADLPDQSGRPVADHTVAHLFAHGNPDPVRSQPVAAHVHDQVAIDEGCSVLVAVFKIRVLFQRFHMYEK